MLETPLHDESKVIIEAQLIDEPKIFYKGRLSRLTFHVNYHEEPLTITIFNRHFLKKNMQVGMMLTITGKYSASKKANTIPLYLCQKYHLIDKEDALFKIHQPQTRSDVISALRYLKYEEFFKFQMTMQYIKQNRTQNIGISKLIDKEKVTHFIEKLPFQLTDDQQKVVDDILIDLTSQKLMYRFVQGDVGSGKTVVAAISLYANYLAGYQGAMMAPTEILALQHYQSLKKMFKKYKINIALLTGHLSQKEKNEIYQQLENGQIDIIIGTHALFQEKVQYNQLGLVITDEQHRFGVEQRKALKDKGNKVDFLVMTATPIPRTLAISLYGDMDVSTIKTLPNGRKKVITKFIKGTSMKPILKDLKDYLLKGGQCYVVCPLVNESEAITGRNASDISKAMAQYFKGQYEVGLVHGQMSDEEKNKIMNAFKENKIQILVSTTVIEVGVDVSNANMMVIYNAERLGRSKEQGYCYLLSDATHSEQKERLEFLENHHDGFEVSEYDLKIRGPGDLLGQKQSGLPTFMIGDIFKDYHILEITRKDAFEAMNQHQDDEKIIKLLSEIKNNLIKNNEYID